MLPQDTTHLSQRPCCQPGSPCQDPAGNWTTQRPPDHWKENQTAVVWSCFMFIRSGQNHFAGHSEKRKKTRQTEEEVGRQHQGMDRPRIHQVPECSGEQGKLEEAGCEIICGAPMTLVVKGQMMMIMIMNRICTVSMNQLAASGQDKEKIKLSKQVVQFCSEPFVVLKILRTVRGESCISQGKKEQRWDKSFCGIYGKMMDKTYVTKFKISER